MKIQDSASRKQHKCDSLDCIAQKIVLTTFLKSGSFERRLTEDSEC